ncbi:MAG: NAD(P)/FAD-dependent oxidoreductase [Gemmatimonadota bacterium]
MAPRGRTSDLLIVGAGVMGCSAAFHLAGRGLRVTVLEKGAIGAGSTGRSSAIIRQHYSNRLTIRMALHSLRVFQEFDERVGGECGFRSTGWVGLVAAEDEAGLMANLALQRSLGVEARLLEPEELDELFPGLEMGDAVAAAYEPRSGHADPHLTVHAYAEAARRRGATILLDAEVTGLRFAGGRIQGVETREGTFQAPIVVNCAGPWSARVSRSAGVDLPVTSCRAQVACFRRPATLGVEHPVVIDFVNGTYFRSETGGLTLVGSIDPSEGRAVVDPDDFPEHVDGSFVAAAGERLLRRLPPMERGHSTGGYAGLYAVTPDWHPIVDEVPPESGCFVCAGFSGHGYKLAPAVGRMVADLVTGASDPEFDPHLFRFARFAEEEPVRGRYAYSITG